MIEGWPPNGTTRPEHSLVSSHRDAWSRIAIPHCSDLTPRSPPGRPDVVTALGSITVAAIE